VSALVCFAHDRVPPVTAVSSVSTRAVRPAQSAKLKEYPIQLVRCGLKHAHRVRAQGSPLMRHSA